MGDRVQDAVDRARAVLDGLGAVGADGAPKKNWNATVGGAPSAVPVAIGGGMLAASSRDSQGQERVSVLQPKSGKVTRTIWDATRPVVMDNGSVRVLRGERPCGSHEQLVALTASGDKLWTYTETEHRGIVDYSPGPGAMVYIVTEERALRAIDPAGNVKWTFVADCPECTIAGAPTVTHDRLYFPVWEGGEWACQADRWATAWGTDPLYSLRFDGSVEWVAHDRVAIDAGPMLVCIENARTGLIWKTFASHDFVRNAYGKLGLKPARKP